MKNSEKLEKAWDLVFEVLKDITDYEMWEWGRDTLWFTTLMLTKARRFEKE